MKQIDSSLLLLSISPVLVFILHIFMSRVVNYFRWQVPAQKLAVLTIIFGNLPAGLIIWFFVLQHADFIDQFWGAIYCLLVYNALGHIYFHLFNLTQTGIRASLLREIATREQTIDQVINRSDAAYSVERLRRLQDIGVVKKSGDRFYLQSQWLYYVGVVCRAWGYLLDFSEKDNGYIPLPKARRDQRPLWYQMRSLAESNPYSWYFAWRLVHNLPFLLPHDKSYLASRHFGLVPGDLILDVGANDGISALSFYHINPKISVFSIDPNSLHEIQFKKLKNSHPSFSYQIMGAGKDRGSLTLYTPKYRSIYLHTFSSSSESQIRAALLKSFGEKVSAACEMIITQAEIIPLDELALAPKVIKIDVEGFEYSVLQGAKNTILKYRPFIIIEAVHNDGSQVVQFLKEMNYALLDYDYKRNTFQQLSASSGPTSMSRNQIAAPVEKLSTLPFRVSNG